MKKQIGVVFGSRSCEREVSIISAVQLMRHINREKYDVIPVYIDENGSWYTGNILTEISSYKPFHPDKEGVLKVFPDLSSGSGALSARIDVYIIVMHGLNGEDGTLQGLMELANIPYTSTGVAGSSLGMDKIMMKQFFAGAGLPVLPGIWFTRSAFRENPESVLEKVSKEIGFPVFVKPANLGSSIGVSRADNPDELKDSFELAFEYDRRVLVEKGLDKPIELNCSVLGYDEDLSASPIEMPISNDQFLDFQDKYLSTGGSKGMASLHRVLPAPIDEALKNQIQEMSKKIFSLMDCKGVVRIDYMFDRSSENIYITEINTIPGSLAFYLWENAGIPYENLIDRMIMYAEKAYDDKNQSNYAYSSDILNGAILGSKSAKGSKCTKLIK